MGCANNDMQICRANGPNGFQCVETNAVVFQDGTVLWVPPCSIIANCDLTLDTSPYDEQICKLKFGSWTFDGYSMDLQMYKSTTVRKTTVIHHPSCYVLRGADDAFISYLFVPLG